jgi:hypothetical protein
MARWIDGREHRAAFLDALPLERQNHACRRRRGLRLDDGLPQGNRIHVEGWKTNDAFMVHRKFILPSILENSYGRYCLGYGYRTNELDDIDRACAYLDGKSIAPIQNANGETIYPVRTIRQTIQADIHAMRGESTYFKLKWYLKGTVHFEFKYEWMWLKLNVMATDGKQWLPGHLKKEYEQKINQLQLKEGTAA